MTCRNGKANSSIPCPSGSPNTAAPSPTRKRAPPARPCRPCRGASSRKSRGRPTANCRRGSDRGGRGMSTLLPSGEKVGRVSGSDEGATGIRHLAFRSGMNVPLIRQAPPDTFSPGGEKVMAVRLSPCAAEVGGQAERRAFARMRTRNTVSTKTDAPRGWFSRSLRRVAVFGPYRSAPGGRGLPAKAPGRSSIPLDPVFLGPTVRAAGAHCLRPEV